MTSSIDQITKSCDTCSKCKIAPSRAKISGIRSEVFGELTFIDHGEVSINPQLKLQFLLLYDGATFLTTTAYVVQNRSEGQRENQDLRIVARCPLSWSVCIKPPSQASDSVTISTSAAAARACDASAPIQYINAVPTRPLE